MSWFDERPWLRTLGLTETEAVPLEPSTPLRDLADTGRRPPHDGRVDALRTVGDICGVRPPDHRLRGLPRGIGDPSG